MMRHVLAILITGPAHAVGVKPVALVMAPAVGAPAAAPSLIVPARIALPTPLVPIALAPTPFSPMALKPADPAPTAAGPLALDQLKSADQAGTAFFDGVGKSLAPYIDGPTNLRTRQILSAYLRSGDFSRTANEVALMAYAESRSRLPLVRLVKNKKEKDLHAIRERLRKIADAPAVLDWRGRRDALELALKDAVDENAALDLLFAHYAWVHEQVTGGRFTPYYARLVNGLIYAIIPRRFDLNASAAAAVERYPIGD